METSLETTPITKAQPAKRQPTPSGFVQNYLPWIVAAGFLAIYGVTLARWVNYQSLQSLARAAGWDWELAYHAPLHFLSTYPVRWLPAAWSCRC